MLDKYMFALGRGVRGVMKALDDGKRPPDAENARDVAPPQGARPAPAHASLSGPAQVDGAPLRLTGRTLIMGVVNVTPDSFSDGGSWYDHAAAIAHGRALAAAGADILDVGGESSRPGAEPVSAEDEIARVLPVVRALALESGLPVSIDTTKAAVAARAIEAGARVVNDVWGFQRDGDIARVVAQAGVHCVLMHNRAQDDPGVDIFAEVVDFLSRSIDIALAAGVARERIVVDPGIGFGKTHAQSFEMIRRLPELRARFDLPVLLGASRKRCIGEASGVALARERVAGSVAAHLYGAMNGADIVRVHDVGKHRQALGVLRAIEGRDGEA